MSLDAIVCPGCGEVTPGFPACPHCGYENNVDGRLLSLAELLAQPNYPEAGALRLNDVSSGFLRVLVAKAQQAAAAGLAEQVRQLREDLAEADRRAGAAERLLAREKEGSAARDSWLRNAKEQWGVSHNVSFDRVWDEALALKAARDAVADEIQKD